MGCACSFAPPGYASVMCRGVCVCVCPSIQSEDKNKFFTFKVRTFWQCEVKISVLALWLGALSSLFPYMGMGGMDIILSLYVPGMFRDVWKNVLTLNVLYTDLFSLWMLGQTHYTHGCIVCPHFECRDRWGWGVCVGRWIHLYFFSLPSWISWFIQHRGTKHHKSLLC